MSALSTKHELSLHSAAEENDLVRLEQLLLDGNSYTVNLQDQHGRTALHCLLDPHTFSDLDEVKRGIQILLDSGADINIQNEHGETPLHTVVQNYLEFIPEIIRYILTHSKTYIMETQDEEGFSLFHLFMSDFSDNVKEKKEYQKLLLEKNEFIKSLLCGEIMKCNCSALLNQKERKGYSAFLTFLGNSDCPIETVQLMIDCGADVNTSTEIGTTPLMESVFRRRKDIVEILLKAGANPNQTDIFGQSCIFRVYTTDCFELLSQYGANFYIKDKFGRTPITNVALYTPEDLPQSSIVISQNFSKHSPLFEKFLDIGVNCNEVDKHGSSLLHYGAWYGDSTMIKALIQHGADLNILDFNGYLPLDLAMHVGNDTIYSLLGGTHEADTRTDNETKYCKFLINETETDNMKTVLNEYLGIKDDPAYLLMSLVKSPRLGMTEIRAEPRHIKSEVTGLMHRIADVIGRLNPLFTCTVYPTGSSSEGTKVADPDEFDFVFCLNIFSNHCIPHQDVSCMNSGFVSLKIKSNEVRGKFESFLDDETFSAELIRGTFQDLVTFALNNPDVWTSEYLCFEGLVDYPADKPVLKLEIDWYGPIMKHIVVSVDIVPAVQIKDWKPVEIIDKQAICSVTEQYLLILHSPERCPWSGKKCDQLVRISSSLMEKQLLSSLPYICTESYAAAKILKSFNFCPKIQFDEEIILETVGSIGVLFDEPQSSLTGNLEDELKMEDEGNLTKRKEGDEGIIYEQTTSQILPSRVSHDISKSEDVMDKTQTSEHRPVLPWMMDIDETYNSSKNLNEGGSELDDKEVNGQPKGSLNSVIDSEQNSELDCADRNNITENVHRNSTQDSANDSIKSTNDNTDEDVGSEENSENLEDDSSGGTEWEGSDVVSAFDEISSFMLKMCLFHVVQEEKTKNGDVPTFTLLELTIKIYEKLLTFAKEGRLPSYFLPFLDVLTYVKLI
ncbi:uncharacterized protein LOC133195188 [Saccostrea echinata]|uniref:uncharacterized protein LOC133195188 n=1 Tax=Saccostrea echinata TaxID=191078 RepID=UPI002A828B14|nr:uncharacterized protein LOC133195188 [Saccostrea echinata]